MLAHLAANGGVYEDYLAADRLRSELAAARIEPWITSPAESSQLLCTWNAHSLLSLAQALVDAEGLDPARGGFLPQVTAEQALRFLRETPSWAARARRAAVEPGYDVAAEVRLPAPLPPWVVVEPCPRSHLVAMQAAGSTMLDRIQAILGDLERTPSAAGHPVATQLRGWATEVQTRLEYGTDLFAAAAAGGLHEDIENALREGVAACHLLGQVLARPRLHSLVTAGPVLGPPFGYPAPGDSGHHSYGQGHHHHGHH